MDSNTPRSFVDLVTRLRLAFSRLACSRRPPLEPQCPPVLIVSPGGVASTALMEHIARFVSTNSPGDRDGLKHTIRPPSDVQKAILVTGNPREVAASLRRRGYLGIHSAKMGSPIGVLLRGDAQQEHFESLVKRQQLNFSQDTRHCLVLDYREAFESCRQVAEFLGLPVRKFCSSYPERRDRRAY